MTLNDIGFSEAMRQVMIHSGTIGIETIPVSDAAGRIAADDVLAVVDSPSVDVSLKDGYAVISGDVADASADKPVKLKNIDRVVAGDHSDHRVCPGETIRILSGAPLPEGAQAVLTEELSDSVGDYIYARADAHPGRNILVKGGDVSAGQVLIKAGTALTPQRIGLMTAGGVSDVAVFKRPRIGLLGTGSEVIMPGEAMSPGKVYASNIAIQNAWLKMLGFDVCVLSAVDSRSRIAECVKELTQTCQVVITSGGAWKGDRDLIVSVINSLGGQMVFHRLRLGPGKASGMGIVNHQPVFCLPGGPTSNLFGFVMIVLPALFRIAGASRCPYLYLQGKLEKDISGQLDWTNLVQCDIIKSGSEILLRPVKLKSRLWAMATNPAIVVVPEGVEKLRAGDTVPFICLDTEWFTCQIPG